MNILLLSVLVIASSVCGNNQDQGSQTLKITSEVGSQTVFNVQWGGVQPSIFGESIHSRYQGRPGKRGATGPNGENGRKGDRGVKGEPGNDVDTREIQQIVGSMAVSSCQDLRGIGISTPGYYLMRDPEKSNAIYVYCDFEVRLGVSTCKQLSEQHKIYNSGFYFFKVTNSTQTFQVYCNFEDVKIVTEIWHDEIKERKIKRCEAKGCHSVIPQYNIDAEHILQVIENSAECRQYIKLRCSGVVIAFTTPNDPFAWWMSRDGEKMLYWGGAMSRRSGFCECGESSSCISSSYKCNCDNNGNTMTQDEGYLTDKTKLPVKKMFFGDAGDASENGWHSLGRLECMG